MEPEELATLGDHPALDFVNSTATSKRQIVELIPDGDGYVRWLRLAGLISADEERAVRALFSVAELDAAAVAAVELRERLRPVIAGWARAELETADESTVAELNAIFERGSRRSELIREDEVVTLVERRIWGGPLALLVPAAEAVADLFAHGERSLVRPCEGVNCTLFFYDRTKAHRRRWCSMAVCGNRAKAREHRARQAISIP